MNYDRALKYPVCFLTFCGKKQMGNGGGTEAAHRCLTQTGGQAYGRGSLLGRWNSGGNHLRGRADRELKRSWVIGVKNRGGLSDTKHERHHCMEKGCQFQKAGDRGGSVQKPNSMKLAVTHAGFTVCKKTEREGRRKYHR